MKRQTQSHRYLQSDNENEFEDKQNSPTKPRSNNIYSEEHWAQHFGQDINSWLDHKAMFMYESKCKTAYIMNR